MKYLLVKRLALISAIAMGAAQISLGVISVFSFDIFKNCFEGTTAPDAFVCEYGPQVMVNGLGALIFFAFGWVLLYHTTRMVKAIPTAVMALAFALISMAFWRFEITLSDNFFLQRGPESYTEYGYLALLSLDTLLVGLIIGGFYHLAMQMSKNAIAENKRTTSKKSFLARFRRK